MVVQKTLLGLIITILCGVVFHAPLSVWLGSQFPDIAVAIKAWKEVLLMLAGVLVAVEVSRRHMWKQVLSDWIVRLVILFALIHIVMLPFMWQGAGASMAGLMIDLRFVAFFIVVYAASLLYPGWRKWLLWGSFAVAALSILFAVLQATVLPHDILSKIGYSEQTITPYQTVDQNYDYIRVNGTLRGPNPLGAYAVIILALSVTASLTLARTLRRVHKLLPWLVGALGIASLIVLWFTYSRSAALASICAVGIILVGVYGRKLPKKLWIALGASLLLMLGGLYLARDTHFVSHVIMHEDPNEGGDYNSNDGHWDSLVEGATRMVNQPFGAGIGSTGSPSLMTDSPLLLENYFFYVAHEVGWIGLLVFMTLVGAVGHRLYIHRADWLALALLASGAGLMFASVLLPVWADDTVSLVWWGLAGVALARKREDT